MKPGRIDVILIAAIVVGYAALAAPSLSTARFSYDEADYMYAVSKGFGANYLDRPTISFATFVQKGVEDGIRRSARQSLSEYIRARDDVAFYRHFHGPLYFYWVILHATLLGTGEQSIRWASLTCLLLASVVVYLGCLAVARRRARTTAVVASTMLLACPANIATTQVITAHAMYVVTVILALVAMAKLVDSGNTRYWYYSLAAVTLALLTMEFAPLLAVTLAVCAFVRRGELFAGFDRRRLVGFLARSVLLVLSVCLVVWPAGLFKLTVVKNYLFFTYIAFSAARSFSAYRLLTGLFDRISDSPGQFSLAIVGVALALYVLKRYRVDAWLLPFAVYGPLILIANALPASSQLTYISSLFPVVVVIAGALVAAVLGRAKPVVSAAITTAIVAGVAIIAGVMLRRPSDAVNLADLVVEIIPKDDVTRPDRVVLPMVLLPTVHYYFPDVSTIPYATRRSCGEIAALVGARDVDGVVCTGSGQDALYRELARDHDVEVHRLGSPEIGRELVYYGLTRPDRR